MRTFYFETPAAMGDLVSKHERDLALQALRAIGREANTAFLDRRRAINKERNARIAQGEPREAAMRMAGKLVMVAKAEYCVVAEKIHADKQKILRMFA